jgi:hypothetical protein
MSRIVTTYERELAGVFSSNKIVLDGHSSDFSGYTKDIGNFDIISLVGRKIIPLNEDLMIG